MTPRPNEASAMSSNDCRLLTMEIPLSPSTMVKLIPREVVVRGMADELNSKEMVRLSWRGDKYVRNAMKCLDSPSPSLSLSPLPSSVPTSSVCETHVAYIAPSWHGVTEETC